MNSLLGLFLMFLRLGAFSFGGGYAMLPLIFQSVQQFDFMTAEEFSNLVALSQVTPGPVAVNAATYVGFNFGGVEGAVIATAGVALPSFILIIIISAFLERFKENKITQGMFTGIRPVTAGLIASAALVMGRTVIVTAGSLNVIPACIFAATFVLSWKFKISPIKLTLIMGAVGAFICA